MRVNTAEDLVKILSEERAQTMNRAGEPEFLVLAREVKSNPDSTASKKLYSVLLKPRRYMGQLSTREFENLVDLIHSSGFDVSEFAMAYVKALEDSSIINGDIEKRGAIVRFVSGVNGYSKADLEGEVYVKAMHPIYWIESMMHIDFDATLEAIENHKQAYAERVITILPFMKSRFPDRYAEFGERMLKVLDEDKKEILVSWYARDNIDLRAG